MINKFKKFSPNFSLLPYIICLVIVIAFFIAEYFMYKQGAPYNILLFFLIFIIIGVIILIKGALFALGAGYYYGIDKEGIIASLFFKKKRFSFSEIDKAIGLTFNQTADLFYRVNNNQIILAQKGKFKELFSSGLGEMNLRRYCTYSFPRGYGSASINIGKIGFGFWMKAIKVTQGKGEIVLIVLKNGEMHLLAPKNVQEFLKEFEREKYSLKKD